MDYVFTATIWFAVGCVAGRSPIGVVVGFVVLGCLGISLAAAPL